MWEQIRANFLQALIQQRVDKWLVEEARNTGEVLTRFRQLGDIQAFASWLDEQVLKEKAVTLSGNDGAIFISFRSSRHV